MTQLKIEENIKQGLEKTFHKLNTVDFCVPYNLGILKVHRNTGFVKIILTHPCSLD